MQFDRLHYLLLEEEGFFFNYFFERRKLKIYASYLRIYFKKATQVYIFFFSVPQMLAMMVDLEEDEDWANADELEDDDFDR